MDEFISICNNLQIPHERVAAEHQLSLFKNHPNALNICNEILHSSASSIAQFHASLVLKQLLLSNYSIERIHEITTISDNLLSLLVSTFGSAQHYIRESLLSIVALVCKRTWMDVDPSRKSSLFQLIAHWFQNPSPNNHQIALSLISALLNEFSSDKATFVGLPSEFHFNCRKSFQDEQLLPLLGLVLNYMHPLTLAQTLDSNQCNLLGICFVVVEKIQSWEFITNGTSFYKLMSDIYDLKSSFEAINKSQDTPWSIIYPSSWQDILTRPQFIDMFFKGHNILKFNSSLSHRSRQCLIQLASISGKSFAQSNLESVFTSQFLSSLIKLLKEQLLLAHSPDSIDEDELLGITQITKRILKNHSFNVLASNPDFKIFLRELGNFSLLVVGLCSTDEEDPYIEGFDDLLDIWASILMQSENFYQDRNGTPSSESEFDFSSLMSLCNEICTTIFQEYLNYLLRFAESHALDQEEDEHGFKDQDIFFEQLTNASLLGRLNPTKSFTSLIGFINQRCDVLEQLLKTQTFDQRLSILYEQLHWLILISGYLMADSGLGETPMIPESIIALSINTSNQMDCVVTLSKCIFRALNIVSLDTKIDNCSPLIIETLLWFVERWSRSYLFIESSEYGTMSESLISNFGSPGHGRSILNYILDIILKITKVWSSESDLIIQVIMTFKGFSLNKNTCESMLQSENFDILISYFLNNLSKLPSNTHSLLVETVATISSRAQHVEMRNRYFVSLSNTIESRFSELLSRPNFISIYKQQSFMELVIGVLEMYDGLSISAVSSNSVNIFDTCSKHFSSFIKLLDMYHNFPEFELYIIQIFSHLAENLDFEELSIENRQMLNFYIGEMISIYAKNEKSRVRVQAEDNESELFEDLSLILSTLANLITAEYEGFDKVQIFAHRKKMEGSNSVFKVVFSGINAIIPLISESMLTYPSLCKRFITLITEVFEYFPDKLGELNSDLLSSLMKALEFGMNHAIFEVGCTAFEAIINLGLYSWIQNTRLGPESTSFLNIYLDSLLQKSFGYILFQEFDSNLVSHAGDALFALSVARPHSYQALSGQILNQQLHEENKNRLLKEIQELTEIISKVANYQHASIINGELNVGFGEFNGIKRLHGFKEYRMKFLEFISRTRGILRVNHATIHKISIVSKELRQRALYFLYKNVHLKTFKESALLERTLSDCMGNQKFVKNLKLSFELLPGTGISKICELCPNLETIDASGCESMTDDILISAFGLLKNLLNLYIRDCGHFNHHAQDANMVTDASIISVFDSCPTLQELDASYLPITNHSFITIRPFTNLKILYVAHTFISDDAVLAMPFAFPFLEVLDISQSNDLFYTTVLFISIHFKSLKYFNAHGTNFIKQETKNNELEIESYTPLNYLYLQTGFTIGITSIFNHWIYITELNISYSDATDDSIQFIVKKCTLLRIIDLSYCVNITIIGLNFILNQCYNLIDLSLSGCSKIDFKYLDFDKSSVLALNLSFTKIADNEIIQIIQNAKLLNYLDLQSTKLSITALLDIFEYCIHLKSVNVSFCKNIKSNIHQWIHNIPKHVNVIHEYI